MEAGNIAINGAWLQASIERAVDAVVQLQTEAKELERLFDKAIKQPLALSSQQLLADLAQMKAVAVRCQEREFNRTMVRQPDYARDARPYSTTPHHTA